MPLIQCVLKLISDIINSLIDDKSSLNSALLKTKVLASRIDSKELLNWVNHEISGYVTKNDLPEYRNNISSFLKGTYINGNMKYSNQPIPTLGLGPMFEDSLNKTYFLQSISILENYSNEETTDIFESPIPAEIVGFIEENWRKLGNSYLQLVNVNKIIPKSSYTQIVTIVRNKLLDFMLEIDAQFGNITEIDQLKKKPELITKIVNKTIINNIGDGNISNTGDNATIKANIKISKGNKEQLLEKLKSKRVNDEDAVELIEVIDKDSVDMNSREFGPQVKRWITKMLGKSVEGTWDIGIEVAGGFLLELIKDYYGM